MDIQQKMYEIYKSKTRDKYANIINKTQKIEDEKLRHKAEAEAFKKIYISATKGIKRGDLDILQEFLKETELSKEFIESFFYDLFRTQISGNNLAEFVTKVGIDELELRYGNQLAEKIRQLQLEEKINYIDVQQLIKMQRESTIAKETNPEISNDVLKIIDEKQAEKISNLLDIFTNDKLKVGIHRTGGSISGKEICRNGLFITGHLSSGVMSYSKDSIESTLSKNISFYNNPGIAIQQICCGGNYKNYGEKDMVDIILVGIPTDKLDEPENGIILYDYPQKILNPEYILGTVTVSPQNNTMLYIDRNKEKSKYTKSDIERLSTFPENIYKQNIEDSAQIIKMIENSYKKSQQPEYQETKKGLMHFMESLVNGKPQNKKPIKEYER